MEWLRAISGLWSWAETNKSQDRIDHRQRKSCQPVPKSWDQIGVNMRRRIKTSSFFALARLGLAVLISLHLEPSAVFARTDLWVAVGGSDDGPGTRGQPLATIQAALSRDPKGHIMISAGTYRLLTPLVLDEKNAGVVLEGAGPGQTILSGAAALTPFEQVNANLWRGRANMPVSRVWMRDKAVPSAKVPSIYWHYITEQTGNERDPASLQLVDLSHRAFHPEPADMALLSRLSAEELADVVVTLWHSWEISKHHIARIDGKRDMIYLADESPWAIHEFGDVQRYQLDNVPGISDEAGTWYSTGKNGIYYGAAVGQDMKQTALVASGLPHILEIHDTQGITIRNVQFSFAGVGLDQGSFKSNQAASTVDAAIMLDDAKGIHFEHITISHIGGYGVWFRRNCQDSTVQASLIEDMGAGGVRIGETATAPLAGHETTRILVDNNIIREGGRIYQSAVGLLIGRSGGNRVTHNEIHDFYYSGISVGWKWDYGVSPAVNNVIENNHIHHIGQQQLSDMAGIYTLGESPGTVVRANIIHDVTGYPGGAGAWGMYADQASSEIVFENNLVFRTTSGGFHENFGSNNVVRGNVLAFGRDGQVELTKAEAHRSLVLTGNAVISDGATFFRGDWRKAMAQIDKNTYFDVSGKPPTWLGMNFATWKQLGFDQNSVLADPGFVDSAAGNFRLKPASLWSWSGQSPIGVAGVYGAQQWLALAREGDQIPTASVPTPPAAAPISIEEDFESTPVGSTPAHATANVEGLGDGVSVSDETALSGSHSLRLQDVANEKFAYDPHFFYQLNHRSGTTTVEFRFYTEPSYCFSTEWRDGDSPYHIGPSLTVSAGQLSVGGKPLAPIPARQWVTVKMEAQEGSAAERVWHLAVSVPNGASGNWTFPDPSDQWRRLEWLGFTSACRSNAKLFIDDIKIENH
jgi:hypothetical protein